MPIAVDKVKDCNTCPFSFPTFAKVRCLHPSAGTEDDRPILARKMEDLEDKPVPSWCPLPKTPVLVKFVGRR